MRQLTRDEAVVLGLLSQFRRPVLRTKLVKLIYLLDNLRFENTGEQATDFRYIWDYYGPNALGNAITDTLASLAARDLVSMTEKLTPYENYAHYYKVGASVDVSKLPLDVHDWAFITAIVGKYGKLNRSAVVAASKQTTPMKRAARFALLELQPNATVDALKESFFADPHFVEQTRQAAAASGQATEWNDMTA